MPSGANRNPTAAKAAENDDMVDDGCSPELINELIVNAASLQKPPTGTSFQQAPPDLD